MVLWVRVGLAGQVPADVVDRLLAFGVLHLDARLERLVQWRVLTRWQESARSGEDFLRRRDRYPLTPRAAGLHLFWSSVDDTEEAAAYDHQHQLHGINHLGGEARTESTTGHATERLNEPRRILLRSRWEQVVQVVFDLTVVRRSTASVTRHRRPMRRAGRGATASAGRPLALACPGDAIGWGSGRDR